MWWQVWVEDRFLMQILGIYFWMKRCWTYPRLGQTIFLDSNIVLLDWLKLLMVPLLWWIVYALGYSFQRVALRWTLLIMSKKLKRQASHSSEPKTVLAHFQTGELKIIGETASQRKFCSELASHFTKNIDVNEVYELFLGTVGRLLVSLACFFETGWFPACLLSEALRERISIKYS